MPEGVLRPPVEAEGDIVDPKAQQGLEHEELLARANEAHNDFMAVHQKTIEAYAGREAIHFTVKSGGWYIDLETGRTNVDPKFFLDKGYGESEALFATFHEMEHFRDAASDPEAYRTLFKNIDSLGKVHPVYPIKMKQFVNCVDDIMVNRVVMGRWSSGDKSKDALYPKLFPKSDFTDQPKHKQMMCTLLREAMLPDEPCVVDEDVREIIDKYNARTMQSTKRKTLDVLTGFSARKQRAGMEAKDRYEHMMVVLEPMFRKLFLDDVKKFRESQEKDKGEGESGGTPDPFKDGPLDEAIGDPISTEDILNEIDKYNTAKEARNNDEFKNLMGVEKKDFDAYKRDFNEIEPYLEQMSDLFDRLIQERISYRQRLSKPAKEGPALNPGTLAMGAAAIKAGNLEPEIFLDYEPEKVVEKHPSRIELSLRVDGTGSVAGDPAKLVAQRRTVVLFLEAIQMFREKVSEANFHGAGLDLQLVTDIKQFSTTDQEIIPPTDKIDHLLRVKVHKTLTNGLLTGDNNEVPMFDNLMKDLTPEKIEEMWKGDLKKIVIIMTDGGTSVDAKAYVDEMKEKAGTDKNYAVGAIGYGSDGKQVESVYDPVGVYCPQLAQLTETFEKMLTAMLE
jgi:hypothetical protein